MQAYRASVLRYNELHQAVFGEDGPLPWLENYTFPEEERFSAQQYSAQAASFFIAELLRHGDTTALTFATSLEATNPLSTSTAIRL
jgi:cytosine/adenosine deaminase-related metal-dependent hydrolase